MTMDPGLPAAGDSGGRLEDRRMVEVPMTELLLGEREQTAVRAVIASEPVPGVALPGAGVLQHLSHLIDCDAIGIALLDGTGRRPLARRAQRARPRGEAVDGPPHA